MKTIKKGELASEMEKQLLLREARIAAGLDHPCIVPVYDVGTTDDGVFYIVAKFIDGHSLRYFVQEHQPNMRTAPGGGSSSVFKRQLAPS